MTAYTKDNLPYGKALFEFTATEHFKARQYSPDGKYLGMDEHYSTRPTVVHIRVISCSSINLRKLIDHLSIEFGPERDNDHGKYLNGFAFVRAVKEDYRVDIRRDRDSY